MEDSFLTVAEVAELLKLNQQTIRNWIDRGELRAVRVGQRRVRIRKSDLDQLLSTGTMAPAGDDHERDSVAEAQDPVAQLWLQFDKRMSEAQASIAEENHLAEALRSLADAATRLADALRD
jgi:excisionase family DNA binding protein